MKCKDCGSTLCIYRTCGDEQDCFYESHPDYTLPRDFGCAFRNNVDWHSLRNQAAIAAMQSIISNEDLFCRIEEAVNHEGVYDAIASDAVKMGNALIEELKKK